jgi:hypothetical protein
VRDPPGFSYFDLYPWSLTWKKRRRSNLFDDS